MTYNTQPYANYSSAAIEILKFIKARVGFDLWMVTRVDGEDWVVLDNLANSYGVHAGSVSRWSESYCSHMVSGDGPRIAPNAACVQSYAGAGINKVLQIGAYAGVPLTRADGTLFGTLCGIDPHVWPESIIDELPVIEMCARFLSTLLVKDAQCVELHRKMEKVEAVSMRDALTMLYNRRGWDSLAEAEFLRCRRHDLFAAVVSIDLDDLKKQNDTYGHEAGDGLLREAGQVILKTVRSCDVAARVGGDEFNILFTNCNVEEVPALIGRLTTAFEDSGVRASIGWAGFANDKSMERVCASADIAMYANKAKRKAGPCATV